MNRHVKSVHAAASTVTDGDDAASPEVSAIPEEGERVLCCCFFKRVHELSDFYHLPLVSRVISSPLDGERERERETLRFFKHVH